MPTGSRLQPGRSVHRAQISGLNHRGEGVGRILSGPEEGMAVFIPGTVPGDIVEFALLERKKNYMRGQVVSILDEGPGREKQVCPVAHLCGGCSWQHITYPLQLEWKKRIVIEALSRIARIRDCEVRDCLPSPDITGYRNKVEVPVALQDGRVVAGFYKPYTHDVVPTDECPLEHPLARELVLRMLDEVRDRKYSVYDERTGRGLIRHLMARIAPGTGERMAVVVANGLSLPGEAGFVRALTSNIDGLVSVVLNTNTERTNIILGQRNRVLRGRYHIEDLFGDDRLGRLRFRISPLSFYQVNSPQAARLYRMALDAASVAGSMDGGLVFDVYSGIGTITLFAARRASLAVGIEEVGDAVRDAKANARLNGIDNVRFYEGRAERILGSALRELGRPDTVILDPPRGGADEGVLLAITRSKPRAIVYVSCNPATLARDLITLGAQGYRPEWVQPVDMFPMTPHVESVTLITRVSHLSF
ncbi:MAG: 23S rRNA (uracil(1939)-C(5))-methyltransferase RlmD [Bacillota bacterium]